MILNEISLRNLGIMTIYREANIQWISYSSPGTTHFQHIYPLSDSYLFSMVLDIVDADIKNTDRIWSKMVE